MKLRKARNFIAHEITYKSGELSIYPERLKEFTEEISEKVSIISEADKNICGIVSTITEQPIPTDLSRYPKNIANWVCEPLKMITSKSK